MYGVCGVRVRARSAISPSQRYKNITTEELCNAAGYSPAQLRRLFPKVYGCTPKDYILKKKMEHVCRILKEEPEKNVEEIAYLLGFCSPTYFCYVFKKKFGISPGAYRVGMDVKK